MMDRPEFTNRGSAGRELAEVIAKRHYRDPVVIALPRGGVPVAVEVARRLNAPLELVFVRKIGLPRHPEIAAAAVVDGGAPELVVNDDVLANAGLTRTFMQKRMQAELAEIERRRTLYLAGRVMVPLEGRTLILVDDGIATGASVRAALKALNRKRPARLILAVPVAPQSALDDLSAEADEIICLETPDDFRSVGSHYRDFHQLRDEEVILLLQHAPRVADNNVPA